MERGERRRGGGVYVKICVPKLCGFTAPPSVGYQRGEYWGGKTDTLKIYICIKKKNIHSSIFDASYRTNQLMAVKLAMMCCGDKRVSTDVSSVVMSQKKRNQEPRICLFSSTDVHKRSPGRWKETRRTSGTTDPGVGGGVGG